MANPEDSNPEFDDLDSPLEEESPLAEPEEWNPSSGIMNSDAFEAIEAIEGSEEPFAEVPEGEAMPEAAPAEASSWGVDSTTEEAYAEEPIESLESAEMVAEPFADVPLESLEGSQIASEPLDASEVSFEDASESADADQSGVPGLSALGMGSELMGTEAVAASTSGVGDDMFAAETSEVSGIDDATTEETAEEPGEEEAELVVPRKPSRLGFLLEGLGVAVAAVVLLATAIYFTDHGVWNGIYFVTLAAVPYTLWKTRSLWSWPEISAPYTAMLAISLVALVTGVYWLGLELARYQWDVKAKKGRAVSVAAPSGQSATSTIAAAWPTRVQLMAKADGREQGIGSPWTT